MCLLFLATPTTIGEPRIEYLSEISKVIRCPVVARHAIAMAINEIIAPIIHSAARVATSWKPYNFYLGKIYIGAIRKAQRFELKL